MTNEIDCMALSCQGELDKSYRFVEFETNGVSFLVKDSMPDDWRALPNVG